MTMRGARFSTLIGCVAAASICLSSCSGGHPTARSAPPSAAIRGSALSAFACSAKPGAQQLSVDPATVVELRVCALSAPAPFNRPAHAISLSRSSAGFDGLLRALSLPDESSTPGQMCPEYAELRAPILARTASQDLLVHLPADGCDHTLPAVSSALAAVTNGSS